MASLIQTTARLLVAILVTVRGIGMILVNVVLGRPVTKGWSGRHRTSDADLALLIDVGRDVLSLIWNNS